MTYSLRVSLLSIVIPSSTTLSHLSLVTLNLVPVWVYVYIFSAPGLLLPEVATDILQGTAQLCH